MNTLAGTTIALLCFGLLGTPTARAAAAEDGAEATRILFLPLVGRQGDAVQAAALLSESMAVALGDAAPEHGVELLEIADLGRVAGRSPQEHLARCSTECSEVCQRRLGRLAGMDWVVSGTLGDDGPTKRTLELQLLNLHAPLSVPSVLYFGQQIAGHHTVIADSERAMVAAVQEAVLALEPRVQDASCCVSEIPSRADLGYFVTPFEVSPAARDGGQGIDLARRLEQAFDDSLRLDAPRLETHSLGTVAEIDTGVFLASCPPGASYQCALQAAENTDVPWAVTGVIQESPAELGARSIQVYFVNRDDPQVGEVAFSQEVVLPAGDLEGEQRFLERVVATFEFFVRGERCDSGCEGDPTLQVSAWLPSQGPEPEPERQAVVELDEVTDTVITLDAGGRGQGERAVIEELDGSEGLDDLDALGRRERGEPSGFGVEGRGGDIVVEGGLSFWYASTGTALVGDVVLDSFQADEALALGSYLVAEQRPSAAATLGLGLGLSRRTDLMLRAGIFSGSYHQALSTKEWDSWDEVVVWDDLDERDGDGGFLAWQAQALLHLSLRRFDEELEPVDEPFSELDDDKIDPTLPPTELREAQVHARLAPFVELGGGVWQLPLPAAQQSHLPSSVQTWDGFTWPTLRLAVGMDYGLASKLDVAVMVPLYLHMGPATHSAEQGELELLSFLEDRPTFAWGSGFEILVRPRL